MYTMKNINDYLNPICNDDGTAVFDLLIISDDGTKYLKYNYEKIVRDFILEHELYKKVYDEEEILEQIYHWFSSQAKINNTTYHRFSLEVEISYFYHQNLELFMIGELNDEQTNLQ